ncbi:hypothetical protein FHG87_024069, partial [Trinorchestia longiramus]
WTLKKLRHRVELMRLLYDAEPFSPPTAPSLSNASFSVAANNAINAQTNTINNNNNSVWAFFSQHTQSNAPERHNSEAPVCNGTGTGTGTYGLTARLRQQIQRLELMR